MVKKPQDPSRQTHAPQDVLSELAGRMAVLKNDVQALAKAARDILEEQWASRHTDIFPRLCGWKEDIKASTYATFSMHKGVLHFEALLSDASVPQCPAKMSMRKGELTALNSDFAAGSEELINLCLGSHEMQFNFASEIAALPISFFDTVTGFVLVRIPGLSPADYDKVTTDSAACLVAIRKVVLAGRLGQQLQGFGRAS